MEEIRQQSINNGTALAPINVHDLPSKGLFYPEGTRIMISSATLGDIKRWSSMREDDINDITEKMQSILESCCKISFGPNSFVRARWKDLIDIDRIYLLFAIHDYTFPEGKNDVMIKVTEKDDIKLHKENVKFMEFSEKLMKYYNAEKRCFSFPVHKTSAFARTGGMMDIYPTTIGVGDWIRDYVATCERRHDNYDRDFVRYASLLIPDWRQLNEDAYYKLIEETEEWTPYEWALISKISDVITSQAATPTIKYTDKGGVEREVPLYFRDGFKQLFRLAIDIDL